MVDRGGVGMRGGGEGEDLMVEMEENGGLYEGVRNGSGVGMNVVDKGLGEGFGDDEEILG